MNFVCIVFLIFKCSRGPHYLFYDFDCNRVLSKPDVCSNNRQLHNSTSGLFLTLKKKKRKNEQKEKENFHMLTFTQWFLLIALCFLICLGLMLLKMCRRYFIEVLPNAGPCFRACSSLWCIPGNLHSLFHSQSQTCDTACRMSWLPSVLCFKGLL